MSEIDNIMKSVTVYVSFMAFFIIERILNIVFEGAEDELNEDNESKGGEKRSRAASKISRLSASGGVKPRSGSTLAATAAQAALHADELINATPEKQTLLEKMKAV